MALPLYVNVVSSGMWENHLAEARESIVAALAALDDQAPMELLHDDAVRTGFNVDGATIETSMRGGTMPVSGDMPQTVFLRRASDGPVLGTVVQSPYPLGWYHDLRDGVRIVADIALRIIDAALADPAAKYAAATSSRSLLNAIGHKVAETQGHCDAEGVDVRLPSPFDLPGCRAWSGSEWTETLDVRHSVWHLVDSVQLICRRRDDGLVLMHLACLPTETPDADLGPVGIMRAIATLPPAPPPRRVAD